MAGSRRIRLSEEANEYLNNLFFRVQSKCEKSSIYKIAFAKGLSEVEGSFIDDFQSDSKGSEIRIDSIENIVFDSLIRQKFQIEVLENKGKYYKMLIDYGAKLLKQEDEGDENKLILELFRNANLPKRQTHIGKNFEVPTVVPSIDLTLGDIEENPVTITWNKKDHTGQHMAITGKTGAGKTQFALELLSQMYEQNNNLNIIFFDYAKGDVASNEAFINLINADVIDVANNGLNYNPFYLEEVSNQKIEELKEIFASIQKRIGPKQSLELYDILREAYEEQQEPDLYSVYNLMLQNYEEQGKNKDVLVELFHKLSIPNIFPTTTEDIVRTISDSSIVYDLHNIDSHMNIKELVTFLILNKIYTESIRLPDSKIDEKTGLREIRTVVVIDEAHNYLDAKNRILERMLREMRSKGVAIILLTQGFDDLVQREFDFSSMLNWIFLMKSDNSKQGIEKSLAVSKELAVKLSTEISTIETGIVYTRKLRSEDRNITKFDGVAFWKRNTTTILN
ncbi:helicase HerA domain-containing protein [Rossellomorea vietnamensis]|uniref:helicase HerA domain-containing protein n=1 Tax=Rossellomorea vietnamensis TaxID=218284 RepID=UPI003CE7DD91